MLTNGIAILSHWFSQYLCTQFKVQAWQAEIINRSYVNIRNSIQTLLYWGRLCTHRLRHMSSEFPSGSEDLLWAAFTISSVPPLFFLYFLPSLHSSYPSPLCLFSFFPYCFSSHFGKDCSKNQCMDGSKWNIIGRGCKKNHVIYGCVTHYSQNNRLKQQMFVTLPVSMD